MKNSKYDTWEFKRANYLMNTNPVASKAQYESYLEKYPNDYAAWSFYIVVLLTLGEFDRATEELNNLLLNYEPYNSIKMKERQRQFKRDITFIKMKLYSYQGKYRELYKLVNENKDLQDLVDLRPTLFYCKKKLGLLDHNKRGGIGDSNGYLYKQIVEYKEEDFMDHIKKHINNEHKTDNDSDGIFNQDFPINKAIDKIKEIIPSKEAIYFGIFDDTYIFKYDNCGIDNNKRTDYFKVIAFHGTNELITMTPTTVYENLPIIDINSIREDKTLKKTSQIDKFNKRFGLR